MTTPLQHELPTVGDTIWVTRTVDLPPGRTLRPADWQPADPVELLGPPRIRLGDGRAELAYPVAIWRTGPHILEIPGPLLLAADGRVDSLPGQTVKLHAKLFDAQGRFLREETAATWALQFQYRERALSAGDHQLAFREAKHAVISTV